MNLEIYHTLAEIHIVCLDFTWVK